MILLKIRDLVTLIEKNMVMKIFIFLLFVFSTIGSVFCNEPLVDNFNIIDSLLTESSESIIKEIELVGIDRISIEINNHPASWLLIAHLHKIALKRDIKLYERGTSDAINLELWLFDATLNYNALKNRRDSLLRVVTTKVSGRIVLKDKEAIKLPEINYQHKDFISYSDIELINSKQHDFAKATPPPLEKNIWEELIEPIIFVSTAVVTVLLLFTIRSK